MCLPLSNYTINSSHIAPYIIMLTVNQQILAAIKFGVSQNKAIYVNLAAIKFGVSPRPVYAVYDRRICWRRQMLAKRRNSPNSPNIIARQNLLIYSIYRLSHTVIFMLSPVSINASTDLIAVKGF